MPSDIAGDDAFDRLERVVRALGDELAFFRRRALDAERRVRDLLAQQAPGTAARGPEPEAPRPDRAPSDQARLDRVRLDELEAENAELRARIAEAAERARAVASRMRFARQQDAAAAARDGVA